MDMLYILYILAAIFGSAAVLFLIWLKKQYEFWEKVGVVTPGAIIFIWKMIRVLLQIDTPADIVVYAYNHIKSKKLRYGGCYFIFRPIFVPVDPELIKKIVVKDFDYFHDRGIFFDEKCDPLSAHMFSIEGTTWRGLRTQISAAFSSGRLKASFHIFTQYGHKLVSRMETLATNGPVEIRDLLARFNSDVIASSGFGITINCLDDSNNNLHEKVLESVRPTFINNIEKILAFIYPSITIFRNIKMIPEDTSNAFFQLFEAALGYRQEGLLKRKDFMEVLIGLKKPDKNNNYLEPLSFNELAAQAFILFFTSIMPPTTVAYFCLYELAANPGLMAKLKKEIADVTKKRNGEVTYESLAEMVYLEKVILETIRKYPVLPNLNRVCTKDYKVPESELIIKAGTKVIISVIGMHHNEDYFKNPEMFDPDRFSEENFKNVHPFTFLPFGKGPRMCIGMRYGFLQTKISVIYLINHFHMSVNSKTLQPLQICSKSNFILTSKSGIWLNCKKI